MIDPKVSCMVLHKRCAFLPQGAGCVLAAAVLAASTRPQLRTCV